MMVALDQIEPLMCVRPALVRTYTQMLIEHRKPPAVKLLIKQGDARYRFKVFDGHHRIAAHRYIGRVKIKAEFVDWPEGAENE